MTHPDFLLLAATVLDEISRSVSDETLLRLYTVFGGMVVSAMEIVDRRDVVCIRLGGRKVYQIMSSAGAPYTLYLDVNRTLPDSEDKADTTARIAQDAKAIATTYCPCVGYAFNVLAGDKAIVCKHILAVLLANKLGKVVETNVGISAAAGLLGVAGSRSL